MNNDVHVIHSHPSRPTVELSAPHQHHTDLHRHSQDPVTGLQAHAATRTHYKGHLKLIVIMHTDTKSHISAIEDMVFQKL